MERLWSILKVEYDDNDENDFDIDFIEKTPLKVYLYAFLISSIFTYTCSYFMHN